MGSTTSTAQLAMPAWTTPAMLTLPTLSSAAPPSPSPPACTPTPNPDVRRIGCATTEGTDPRELALSAPTEHSSTSTCSGASSGTQSTAARPSPCTASTQTPCSTPTCPNPSSTSTETLSHLLSWPTRTPTMRLSTMLHPTMPLLTMLLLPMPLLPSTMPLLIMLPPSTTPLLTMLPLFTMQLPTMQPPSTTPPPSIQWQSPTIPLPSTLHQLSTMQLLLFTMQLHQSTQQLLSMQSMHLPLLLSMRLLQSVTVSHLSQTLESRQSAILFKCDYLSIYSVEYNSQAK